MKKVVIILFILGAIFTMGCREVEEIKCYEESNTTEIDNGDIKETNEIDKEEIKASIKSDKITFFSDKVVLTPVIVGEINKELQYHWILKSSIYNDGEINNADDGIDGLVSNEGPVNEIINNGENVEFAPYAEVSYVDGAYRESKIILQVEEKESNKILAQDEIVIENRQGMYFVNTSEDEQFKNEILKSEKSRMYAEIFDIICTIDTGLNSDGQYINVDTKSFQGFTEEDKVQLFEYLSQKYNKTILNKTFEELESEGYIENMSFNDGMMFKANKYLKNSENEISFEGTKWVSGNGAIGFIAEAEKVNNRWIIKKCQMTWIS